MKLKAPSRYIVLSPEKHPTHCKFNNPLEIFCTHGGWEAGITYLSNTQCYVLGRIANYELTDEPTLEVWKRKHKAKESSDDHTNIY